MNAWGSGDKVGLPPMLIKRTKGVVRKGYLCRRFENNGTCKERTKD